MSQAVIPGTIVAAPLDLTHASPELFAAMAAAQGEIENASKNATNKHLNNKYADLGEVLSEIRAVFPKNGLVLIQSPSFDGVYVDVISVVAHSSGAYITSRLGAAVPMQSIQGVGAGITYLRRYAAASLAGIAQEDEDAETMSTLQSGDGRQRQQQGQGQQQSMPQSKSQRQEQAAPQDDHPPFEADGDEQGEQQGVLFGDDLDAGKVRLLRAKATAAGMSDAQLFSRFGTITTANLNKVLAGMSRTPDQ